jgi:hypothetical protein
VRNSTIALHPTMSRYRSIASPRVRRAYQLLQLVSLQKGLCLSEVDINGACVGYLTSHSFLRRIDMGCAIFE